MRSAPVLHSPRFRPPRFLPTPPVWCSLLLFWLCSTAAVNVFGEEISVQRVDERLTPTFRISVADARAIAGVKIQLSYPVASLKFREAVVSEQTRGFLHVTNDTIPGTLTVVMASATGVSASQLVLLEVAFDPLASPPTTPPAVTIRTCQLMSEKLLELPCKIVDTMVP